MGKVIPSVWKNIAYAVRHHTCQLLLLRLSLRIATLYSEATAAAAAAVHYKGQESCFYGPRKEEGAREEGRGEEEKEEGVLCFKKT